MAVATSRTARYGGAVATFTTAASPGAALLALFNAVDAMLIAAGWTRTLNTGSPGPNRYTSPGESGGDHLFIEMTTGGYGTAAGTDLSGGSFLCISTAQWQDATTNYCNRLGAPRLSNVAGQPSASVNCLTLVASTTYEYAAVCDLDGICIVATPSATANGLRWLWCGNLQFPSRRATFTTTGTVANGSSVVIGLSGNPIAAGYQMGDVMMLAGQQAGGATATLGDLVAFKIVGITTTSVTAETIGGLSATLAIGALVGEHPQPYHAWKLNQATVGPAEPTTALHYVAPAAGYAVQLLNGFYATQNLWSYLVSSNGTGNFDGSTASVPAQNPGTATVTMLTPSGLTTTGLEPRCNANLIRQIAPTPQNASFNTGAFSGFMRYLWLDQRNAGSANTVGTIGRAMQTTEEWVCVTAADSRSYWMGPFPATTPTVRVRKLACTDSIAGDYALVEPSTDASGDDNQITIIDRPYIQDFQVPNSPTNAINQGLT